MLEFASCFVFVHSNLLWTVVLLLLQQPVAVVVVVVYGCVVVKKGGEGEAEFAASLKHALINCPAAPTAQQRERERVKERGERESKCTTILYDIQQPSPQEEKFGCVFCYCFRFKVSTLPFSFVSRTRTGLIKSVFFILLIMMIVISARQESL